MPSGSQDHYGKHSRAFKKFDYYLFLNHFHDTVCGIVPLFSRYKPVEVLNGFLSAYRCKYAGFGFLSRIFN